MKKLLLIILMLCFLTACTEDKTLETVEDVYAPQETQPMELHLTLPKETTVQTLSSSAGELYLCDGFTVAVQTFQGGDLNRTVKETTGYTLDRLTMLETEKDNIACYRLSWVSLGEGGDQAARTMILDDGVYHYAVTVMAQAEDAGALNDTWQEIFASVNLRTAP